MKILIFSDIHSSKTAVERIKTLALREDPDILITPGDISNFGNGYEYVVKELDSLGKPILFVPGNHEEHLDNDVMLSKTKNWINIHKGLYSLGNLQVIGFGGGGFSAVDIKFDQFMKQSSRDLDPNKKIILVTHGPPYNTKLDILNDSLAGNKSYREWIERCNFHFAISGHLHEKASVVDKINNTICINPGPYGKVIIF